MFETDQEKQRRFAMYDRLAEESQAEHNRRYYVISHLSELNGWEIRGLSRWKPGVVKYTAFRKTGEKVELRIGCAKDEVFEDLQLPDPVV